MNQFAALAVGFNDLELLDYQVVAEDPCVKVSFTACSGPSPHDQCRAFCRSGGSGIECAATCQGILLCVCGNIDQ